MTSSLVVILTSFLLLVVAFDSSKNFVAAVGCYSCKSNGNSSKAKFCLDKLKTEGVRVANCRQGTCRKIRTETETFWSFCSAGILDGAVTITRGCGTGLNYGCVRSDTVTMCECSGDLCNGASGHDWSRAPAAAAAVAVLTAAAATLRRNLQMTFAAFACLAFVAAPTMATADDGATPISCYACTRGDSSCRDKYVPTNAHIVNCTTGTCAKVKNFEEGKHVVRGCGTGLDYGCVTFEYTLPFQIEVSVNELSHEFTFTSTSAEICECSGALCNAAVSFNVRRPAGTATTTIITALTAAVAATASGSHRLNFIDFI